MRSLDTTFSTETKCKEHNCSVNNRNILKVYKPDNGFLDKALERKIFGSDYKICDCIILCKSNDIFIVEILCGKLTNRELKEKKEQLTNCCKVLQELNKDSQIKKLILLYDKLESPKKQPQLRKALLNQKLCNRGLEFKSSKPLDLGC